MTGLLDLLLAPRAVAVVGASDDIKAPGGRVLRFMLGYGFAGKVYPVNPRRDEVQGLRAYRDVAALPEAVDLAVIVVPAAAALEALAQCGARGVRVALIGSAGFAEAGPEGVAMQARLAEIARAHGIRLIGPNTNGIINCANGLAATFTPGLDREGLELRDGRLAMISQSGAIGGALFYDAQSSGLPLARLVNTGNEIDVGLEEVLEALVDPATPIDIVLCYIEGLRKPARFVQAARGAAAAGKRIAVLKAGTTPVGIQAAAAHTASLAGEDRVYDGVMRQLGVIRATGIVHLLDIARMLVAIGRRPARRLSIASLSGGIGIMLADAACRHGLELAAFPGDVQAGLRDLLPPFFSTANPLDVGGGPFHDLTRLSRILDLYDANPHSDVSIVAVGSFERRQGEIAEHLLRARDRLAKPLLVVWFGGGIEAAARLNAAGLPCFRDPEQLVAALAACQPVPGGAPAGAALPQADHEAARAMLAQARAAGRLVLDEVESKTILRGFGIPTVPECVVAAPADCAAALAGLRFPVVAKLRCAAIVHKARMGGVRLNLRSRDAAEQAVGELFALARGLALTGADVVLQEQVPPGLELLLGMQRDASFGPVITLGLGGTLAEAWDDVQIRLPDQPLDAGELLGALRHRRLLDGSLAEAVDPAALDPVLRGFAALVRALGPALAAIDINPLLRGSSGAWTAVDAVFFLAPDVQHTNT